jgi:ATP-binding cassette subfamily B (MDR/TAP) protein 1
MGLCFFAAIGSGAAMPLMFVVFGRLVGNFTGYFTPNSGITHDMFMKRVTTNTYVGNRSEHQDSDSTDAVLITNLYSLYMVYIGIARFGLSYISLVRISRHQPIS